MPKMKGLKDLMLPVGNENEPGGYGLRLEGAETSTGSADPLVLLIVKRYLIFIILPS